MFVAMGLNESPERVEETHSPLDLVNEILDKKKDITENVIDSLLEEKSIIALQEYFAGPEGFARLGRFKELFRDKLLRFRTSYHQNVAALFNQIDIHVVHDSLVKAKYIEPLHRATYEPWTEETTQSLFEKIRKNPTWFLLTKDNVLQYLYESHIYYGTVTDRLSQLLDRQEKRESNAQLGDIAKSAVEQGNKRLDMHPYETSRNLAKELNLLEVFTFAGKNIQQQLGEYAENLKSEKKIKSWEKSEQNDGVILTLKNGKPLYIDLSKEFVNNTLRIEKEHRVFRNVSDQWTDAEEHVRTVYRDVLTSFNDDVFSYRQVDIRYDLDDRSYFTINTILPTEPEKSYEPQKPIIRAPSYSYTERTEGTSSGGAFIYEDTDSSRTAADAPKELLAPDNIDGIVEHILSAYTQQGENAYEFFECEISGHNRETILGNLKERLGNTYPELFEPKKVMQRGKTDPGEFTKIRTVNLGGPTIIRIRKTKPRV